MLAKRLAQQLEKLGRERELGEHANLDWSSENATAAASLSKVMARKRGPEISLQIEIETEAQWKLLLKREGLVVVEVYAGWCGPCLSMASILKKVKNEINDERLLSYAVVNSENLVDLRMLRGQSEPAWIFLGGGKPVKLMRGTNAPKLTDAIRSEFRHELSCMEGNSKRRLISLSDEAERRQTATMEANILAVATARSCQDHAFEGIEGRSYSRDELKRKRDKSVRSRSSSLSPFNPDEYGTSAEDQVLRLSVSPEQQQQQQQPLQDPLLMKINNRLSTTLEQYTVLAIQNFLLETGAVTEIKGILLPEFNIVQERYISLDEDGVRSLYGIPYEIDAEEEEAAEDEMEAEAAVSVVEEEEAETEAEDVEEQSVRQNEEISTAVGDEGDEDDAVAAPSPAAPTHLSRPSKLPLPLPPELVGDSLLFLLEHAQTAQAKAEDPEVVLIKTADDFLSSRMGPQSYKEALERDPQSLVGCYGREEWAVGVWSPKTTQDKLHVMINYYPHFVSEMLLPPPKESPKYCVAMFPAIFSNEIMETPEFVANERDVVAQGKMRLGGNFVESILRSRGITSPELEAQKKSLQGFDMFVVSIDERNEALSRTIQGLEPLHYSTDVERGVWETAYLFPHINILGISEHQSQDKVQHTKEPILHNSHNAPRNFRLNEILYDEFEE